MPDEDMRTTDQGVAGAAAGGRRSVRFQPLEGLRTPAAAILPGAGGSGLLGAVGRSGVELEPADDEGDERDEVLQAGRPQGDDGDEVDEADDEADDAQPARPGAPQRWFAQLSPDEQRAATAWLSASSSAQQAALVEERSARKQLEKQLRVMARTADGKPVSQEQLTELADQLRETSRRAAFFQEAARPGINLAAGAVETALTVANQQGYINARSNAIDWDALRADHPYLFQTDAPIEPRQPRPRAAAMAGSGLGRPLPEPPLTESERMNATLRGVRR